MAEEMRRHVDADYFAVRRQLLITLGGRRGRDREKGNGKREEGKKKVERSKRQEGEKKGQEGGGKGWKEKRS